MSATAFSAVPLRIPAPVELQAVQPGERFSPTHMPYAVLALLTVYGMHTTDDSEHRWAVVIDVADRAKNLRHGELIKLHRTAKVHRVEQVQLATYARCPQ